jgi:DsbC/DsbD-like thiol-disulfide interchange protein
MDQAVLDRAAAQADRAAEACEQPYWPGEHVISRRHPLFEAMVVTRCVRIEPGVWRIYWMIPGRLGGSPTTGSGPADRYMAANDRGQG